MGLILNVSTLYVPMFIRKQKLEMLFKATANAFQTEAPSTRGISFNDCLKLYALFTRAQADESLRKGKDVEVTHRLYENAYNFGRQFRVDFKINDAEVMRTGALIYKILNIDFQGEPLGNIVIKRCFFSNYYSSQVCRLISSLDEGLLVGLAGGGKLSFYHRITEGDEYCRACLETNRMLG
jgi:hypothetical protein